MHKHFGLITILALIVLPSIGKVAHAQPQQFIYKDGPALTVPYPKTITLFQDTIAAKDKKLAHDKWVIDHQRELDQKEEQRAIELAAQEQQSIQVQPKVVPQYTGSVHSDDYYVNWIIQHESGGDPYNVNPSSGACGLFQKVPCNVPLGDVAAQMADGLQYINSRYGSPYNAYLFWIAHNWY